jgi:hypothetical protein
LNRSRHVNNNDLLLTYETLKPVSVKEEKVNNILYRYYYFGESIGRVTEQNDGTEIFISDYNKHGFIKGYRNGVLYYVYDLKKEDLFATIKASFKPKFWFGGVREVSRNGGKFIRTDEECQQISKLLKEKQYNRITENKKNKIIITNNGTYFVN